MSENSLTIKDYLIIIVIAIIFTSGVICLDNWGQISLQMYGIIDDSKLRSIMTCGKLLEPVLFDKPWVGAYTIGYANSTNKFYIQYEFTYFYAPHKRQLTKWQEAPQELIAINWDTIELFAGSWLPDRAYPFDGPIITFGGKS